MTAAWDGQVIRSFHRPTHCLSTGFLCGSVYSYFTDYDLLLCAGISLICDNSVRTQNLAFLSYLYWKKRLQMHFLNMYSVITQFAKLAAGEQLCRRCTHGKLYHFKTFKIFSWKITNFELWQCCDSVVTVLWHCCDSAVTVLWHRCGKWAV
jgi:hypothetical protein